MPVNEIIQSLGSWSITLRRDTPRTVLDRITWFGHCAIHSARQLHPETIGDSLLSTARYVGVVRAREFTGTQGGGGSSGGGGFSMTGSASVPDTNLVGGSGMAYWLGDEDGKGSVIEPPGVALTDASFTAGVRALLPASGSITEGNLHSVTGSWTGGYIFASPREALSDFCSYFNDALGEAEWRVNGNGTLDAGSIGDLYAITPRAVIARKAAGQDLALRGLSGDAQTDEDMVDFSTRVIVLAQGEGDAVAVGQATINPNLNPWKDLHGNTVRLTRLVSSSATDGGNADATATLQLNRFLRSRRAVALSSSEMDLRGTFGVGDYVWAYDPDSGLIDTSNEVVFRGQRIYPVAIRCTELTWPITAGMGVAYRDQDGGWTDLTDYVVWEAAENVDLIVGGLSRTLLDAGAEPVGGRPKPDSSIPAAPEWILPFGLSSYQSTQGITRSAVALSWHRPLNTDGTAILDGDHYEIRYRTSAHQVLPVTWDYLRQATAEWVDLVQWNGLLPSVEGPWQYTAVGMDTAAFLLFDLTPGVPYDIQIRAVDNATPPNFGDWSDPIETFQTQYDPYPPSEPAPPEVSSSLIAVQVTHHLGKSSGGTFNLEADLHHLEVHAAYEPTFTPNDSTRLGRLLANIGTLQSQTPVVGTFPISITTDVWVKVVAVDETGNKSGASGGAQSSATLIDDAHISDLSVTKVTAGTITSNWIIGADIATASAGVRSGMNAFGIYAYDALNNQTFLVDNLTGDIVMTGELNAIKNNSAVRVAPSTLVGDVVPLSLPGIYLYPQVEDQVGSLPPGAGRIYGTPLGSATASLPASTVVASGYSDDDNLGALSLADDQAILAYWHRQAGVGDQAGYPVIHTVGGQLIAHADGIQLSIGDAAGGIGIDGGYVDNDRTQAVLGHSPISNPTQLYYYGIFTSLASIQSLVMRGPFAAFQALGGASTLFLCGSAMGSNSGIIFAYGTTMVGTRYAFGGGTLAVGWRSVTTSTQLTIDNDELNGPGTCYGMSWGITTT